MKVQSITIPRLLLRAVDKSTGSCPRLGVHLRLQVKGRQLTYTPRAAVPVKTGQVTVISLPWIYAAPSDWIRGSSSLQASAAEQSGADTTAQTGGQRQHPAAELCAITAGGAGGAAHPAPSSGAAAIVKGSLLFPA